ncbi:MAG: right-handed parallel beta-helix repeat-containing protein [Oscillospiraceae bacterium]|nr:right-handed parallel beta-helix repeat-containing protein [Oscillospiraceae bacterium]
MKHRKRLITAVLTAAMMGVMMQSAAFADNSREVLVTTSDELLAALADAKAGDEIILREGIYQNDVFLGDGIWSAFYAKADGTAEQPIILRSEDPEHPATISGVTQENKVALKIVGSYWEIRDLKVCEAQKGIFLQQSEHSIISGCEVYNVGAEAIHIIDNSSYNLVEDCYVHDAGTHTPQYGEGVYIGSSKNTDGYGYECHYNTVRNCRLGPNIAADHVDIKEFTIGNIVEYCTFDGTGMQGQNGGNSFVEVKGNHCIIRNNTGFRNGCEQVLGAFDANVQVDGWGQDNLIYENTVDLDTADCYLFKGWNCATQLFRNTVSPAEAACSGNRVLQVRGYELAGDVTEDGLLNAEDAARLQQHLLGQETGHISNGNSDTSGNAQLDAFDLCILKKKLHAKESETPLISVEFTQENAGKWRMCNGLGGRELTFRLSAQAGCSLNMGWGYWDPNAVNAETGESGVWNQLSLGQFTLDENGKASITVELPADVTSVALQVYDYENAGTELDVSEVVLECALAE